MKRNQKVKELCKIRKLSSGKTWKVVIIMTKLVWTNAFQNSDKTGPWNIYSRVASVSVNEENDKKIQNDMKGNENDKNQYE